MDQVQSAAASELSRFARAEIDALMRRVFFPPGARVTMGPKVVDGVKLASRAERIERPDGCVFDQPALRELSPQPGLWHFTIWEGSRACAHAMTFDRAVTTSRGVLDVIALAGVCVEQELQGHGMGARVVSTAFAEVASAPGACVLFQTGVPGFYEKLGCRTVDNRFVNRKTALDPNAPAFWDLTAMIYPAAFDWPEGEIDLAGSGW